MQALSRAINRAWQSFSVYQRLALYVLIIGAVISISIFWWQINNQYLVEVPASGGTLVEGIVGVPRFINPLLALSDTDRDLTNLIYSGLTRAGASGSFIPDLAESFDISDDGLTYTFKLKDDLEWSDGKPLTTDDIVFTIARAQDPILKSPRRAAWEGVKVEKVDEQTIKFILKQPYSGFLENTTLGILPAHLWKDVPLETFSFDELNLNPIGSGPYQIKKVAKNDSAGTISYFDLAPFSNFALGKANISHVKIRFYDNDDALLSAYRVGEIESLSAIAPETAKTLTNSDTQIITTPLPRVFGVFFNQSQNKIFAFSEVRQALNQAIDKPDLITTVLNGFGTPLDGPIPPEAIGDKTEVKSGSQKIKAETILENKGWKKGSDGIYQKTINKEVIKLAFTLTTSDAKELKAVAAYCETAWKKLGVDVTIKVFEKGDLSQDIIRPRKYDAVLFGEVIGRNPDPYVFWHSSQRFDPGLNIAMYASVSTDKILEQLRTTTTPEERETAYQQFSQNVTADHAAVFLYAPSFIYLLPTKIKNANLLTIATPSDRFNTIASWYISTDRVWKIFTH